MQDISEKRTKTVFRRRPVPTTSSGRKGESSGGEGGNGGGSSGGEADGVKQASEIKCGDRNLPRHFFARARKLTPSPRGGRARLCVPHPCTGTEQKRVAQWK